MSSQGDNDRLIALVLSFFIPGLGQFYQGRTKVGAILLVLAIVFGGLSIFLIGIPLYFLNWVVNMYDAYTRKLDDYL